MNNDLISREALKKRFDDYIKANPNIAAVFELGKFIIATAPTVVNEMLTPERSQGEWIYPEKTDKEKGYGGYCSNCKCDMPIFVEDWKQKYCETKFCPNCGADMRGGKK